MSTTSDLIKKSHSKRGAPGTLKRKVKGKMTLAKARALKNKPGATTLDKKQANFFINMHSESFQEDVAATSTASIPNPAQTSMGPSRLGSVLRRRIGREIHVTDRRRRKDKPPKMLKRFRKYIDG